MLIKTSGEETVVYTREETIRYWEDSNITPRRPLASAPGSLTPEQTSSFNTFVGAELIPCVRDGQNGQRLIANLPDGSFYYLSECMISPQ